MPKRNPSGTTTYGNKYFRSGNEPEYKTVVEKRLKRSANIPFYNMYSRQGEFFSFVICDDSQLYIKKITNLGRRTKTNIRY